MRSKPSPRNAPQPLRPSMMVSGVMVEVRRDLLRQILRDTATSYAIIGGTGFGKSSLLEAIRTTYSDMVGASALKIRASVGGDTRDLLLRILRAGNSQRKPKIAALIALIRDIIDEKGQLRRSGDVGRTRRVALLIDDVDRVIHCGDIERLFRALIKLNLELPETFRFVLAGGAKLAELCEQPLMVGAVEPLVLPRLRQHDVKLLVSDLAARREGLQLADPTLIDLIDRYAGGNGMLLKIMVESLPVDDGPIRNKHIKSVGSSESFRSTLLSIYEDGFSARDSRVAEALATYEDEDEDFSTQLVSEIVPGLGERDAARTLRDLEVLGLLVRRGDSYEFSNPYYRKYKRLEGKR